MISIEEAMQRLLSSSERISESFLIPLDLSLGCYLSKPITSAIDVPPADNSAMDGFAIRTDEWQSPDQLWPVSQRITAGMVGSELKAKTAARIFTGAEVPAGADAVVMQENCETVEEDGQLVAIKIRFAPTLADNIRPKGQDIAAGSEVLSVGDRVSPQAAGLIASVGFSEIEVFKPLTVAIFSTGDELVEPGATLQAGQIYNSNRYTLAAMLEGMGMEFIDLGIIPDNFEATQAALSTAAEEADVIISSGGVSVGEEDHVKAAVESLGDVELWKLAIKPGKPFTLGNIQGKPFLGLPGNPSAVFVTFCILAWPFLLKTQGANRFQFRSSLVPAAFSWKAGKRQEYIRARISDSADGAVLEIFPNQSSGVLSSAVWATGFAVAPVDQAIVPGDLLEFISFDQFFSV